MDFKGKKIPVNIVYRPIQLGELVFPESALQQVLATLKPMINTTTDFNLKNKNFALELLRKKLKLEKVPEHDGKTLGFPVWNYNLEINPIGIKKDLIFDGFEHL
jgi:hypothetical protein